MRLTVLLAVYNGADELPRTLDSLLCQEFTEFELLVVDDGSSDGSGDVARSFGDTRIRVIRQENQGLTRALNHGIQEARGELLARIDCGDMCHHERLARQVELLDSHPEFLMTGCRVRRVSSEGEPLGESEVITDPKQIYSGLLRINLFQHSSIMVRRAALLALGGYREFFRCSQDYDLFLRLSEIGQLTNLPQTLSDWVMNPESISFRRRPLQAAYADIARQCAQFRRKGGVDPVDAGSVSQPDCEDLSPAARRRAYSLEVARAALMGNRTRRARQELSELNKHGGLGYREFALLCYSLLPEPLRNVVRAYRVRRLVGVQ